MAKESSFDVVSEPDLAELINALDQTRRETATRYDFRGHDIVIEWDAAQYKIRLDSPAGSSLPGGLIRPARARGSRPWERPAE